MDTDYAKPNCARCLKRTREDGGNANCPFLRTIVKGESLYEKYRKQGDHNCGSFALGSRRTRPEPTPLPEEGLF